MSRLAVKEYCIGVFEHPKQLGLKGESFEHHFGSKFGVQGTLELQHRMLMGEMSELLISRACGVRHPISNKIEYSTDERILAAMFDISKRGASMYFRDFETFFRREENKEAKRCIEDFYERGVTVVHACFDCDEFKSNLAAYMSPCDNEALSSTGIWDSTLFMSYVRGRNYIPAVHLFMGYVQCNLDVLHQNVSEFKIFLKMPQFEVETVHGGKVTSEEELAILFPKSKQRPRLPHDVSISGRVDILDGDVLYEIKASTSTVCDNKWVIQALLYAIMLPTPVKTIVVVNIQLGVMYTWEVAALPALDEVVREKIAPHFKWHPIELAAFLQKTL